MSPSLYPSEDTLLLLAEIRALRSEVAHLTHHIVVNLEPHIELLTHRSFASAPPPVVDDVFHDAPLAPLPRPQTPPSGFLAVLVALLLSRALALGVSPIWPPSTLDLRIATGVRFNMDWGLAAAPPPATPERESGTFTSEGGVVGSKNGTVGLCALDMPGLGMRFCGGCVGNTGNKMCVAVDCTTESHTKKADVSEIATETKMVFIYTKEGATTVHTTPAVPAHKFGTSLERYLEDRRQKSVWVALFPQLDSTEAVEEGEEIKDMETLARKLDGELKSELGVGVTPMKKRPKLFDLASAIEYEFEIPLALLTKDLGPTDSFVMANVKNDWPKLSENLDTLPKSSKEVRNLVQSLARGTRSEFEGMDLQVSKLAVLLGNRPKDWGTTSSFGFMKHISGEVKLLEAQLKICESFVQNDAVATKAFKQEIYNQVLGSMQPVIALFGMWSTDKNKPGDKLTGELTALRADIQALKAQQMSGGTPQASTQAPNPDAPKSGISWNLPPTGTQANAQSIPSQAPGVTISQSAPTGPAAMGGPNQAVLAKLAGLEARMGDVEQRLSATAVEMGGTVFRSRRDTKAWLALNAPAAGGYLYFMDAHAFMGLAFQDLNTPAELVKFEAEAGKAGYANPQEAIASTGFRIELPTFFGRDPKATAAVDTRVLPGIKAYDDWDSGNGFTGARRYLLKQVRETKSVQMIAARNFLTGDALMVAKECISDAASFIEDLETWITKEYSDLLNRGGTGKECWQLISHCVRAIFSDLHEARSPGRGPFGPGDREAGATWGFLQAHRKMKAFRIRGFSASPTLSHILNIHLRDHAITAAKFEVLMKEVATVRTIAEAAKKNADQAKTKVKA
jgi:hypothetical protein